MPDETDTISTTSDVGYYAVNGEGKNNASSDSCGMKEEEDVRGRGDDGVTDKERREGGGVGEGGDGHVIDSEAWEHSTKTSAVPDESSNGIRESVVSVRVIDKVGGDDDGHKDGEKGGGGGDVEDEEKKHLMKDRGEEEDEVVTEESQIGLDGGYGWFVVLGAFIACTIGAGFMKSGGLLFLQFQERYQLGALTAAWPGSILAMVHYMSAPLTSATCNRYSVRTSVMIGSALIFVGLILNSLVDSFYFLFFCHSLLQGVGLSFLIIPGLFHVSTYFDKRRGLAVSLATAGGGVGTFAVIPLVNFLFQEYGYQGCFLIMSAVLAHGFVSAMAYKPFKEHQKYLQSLEIHKTRPLHYNDDVEEGAYSGIPLKGTVSIIVSDSSKTAVLQHTKELEHCSRLDSDCRQNNHNVIENCSDCHQAAHEMEFPTTTAPIIERQTHHHQTTPHRRKKTSCYLNFKSSLKMCFPVENKSKNEDSTSPKRKIFDFRLLKDASFLLFLLATVLFTMSMKATYTFIPAVCVDSGLTKTDAALVLAVVGAVDTFGRIGLGFSLDTSVLKPFRMHVFILVLFGEGLASLCIPFLKSFASFAVVCPLMGVFIGAHMSQMAVVLVDLRGKEMLPSCIGLVRLFQAFGVLVGPLLFGAIRDSTGSYDVAFRVGSGLAILAGIVMTTSHMVFRFQIKRKQLGQQEE